MVGIDENKNIPKRFKLYQNYPNPFNPSTTIKYSLPTSTHLVINVFNALGEKVTPLFKGEKERGQYSLLFNGLHLPSGNYFIRLNAGNYSKTIKALLIK